MFRYMTSPPPPAVDRVKFDAVLLAAGHTVTSLASAMGYHRTRLSNIANGRAPMNSRMESSLRQFLGDPAVDLFLTR